MKKILSGISLLTIVAMNVNAQAVVHKKVVTKSKTIVKTTTPIVLANANDSFSYAIGLNLAYDLKQRNVNEINANLVKKGIEDAMQGKTASGFTDQQVQTSIQERLKLASDSKLNAEKAKGAAFLAANGKRAGVITLPDGVQYEVLNKSDSTTSPTAKDTVVANYVGTLMDGTEFDNSYKRNKPITIGVSSVIRGWTEILQMMHIGDKLKVYIPSDMAYGDRGAGNGAIPGGATLIFEIDLIQIIPAATTTPSK